METTMGTIIASSHKTFTGTDYSVHLNVVHDHVVRMQVVLDYPNIALSSDESDQVSEVAADRFIEVRENLKAMRGEVS